MNRDQYIERIMWYLERLSDDVLTLVSGGIDAASDYIENLNISHYLAPLSLRYFTMA